MGPAPHGLLDAGNAETIVREASILPITPSLQEERLEEKLLASGMPRSTIEQVRHLCYTNNGHLCFADLQALHLKLQTADFNNLTEVLCASPVFLLRLHVKEGANVDALVRYWGKGGREKLIAPILTSLARVHGGGSINISYLLPPYPRLRLYTYPDGWGDETAPLQDCAFTALNFFNDSQDHKLFDRSSLENFINAHDRRVEDEPVLGDLVTLADSNNQIIHFSVYIADNFVFTKNGINFNQPWVLMRFSDMLATYQHIEESPRLEVLRRKTEAVTTVVAK